MGLLTFHSTFHSIWCNKSPMKYLRKWICGRCNFVKVSNASMTFATNFDQSNIGIVPHPTLLTIFDPHPRILSYLKTLKQHSLFVPFEDQRIKKYRMNEACQWSLELCYIHNNPDLWELNIAPQHNIGGKENQAWLFKTCGNNERVWISGSGYLPLFLQHNAQRGWMCNIE